jgi:pilus assembly protein CpaC
MPGEPIEVSARGDGLVLTGLLSSSAVAARAAALAERYAPEHVVNLTRIRGAEQVMLKVRVAEVRRNALKQFGLSNLQALYDSENLTSIVPGTFNPDTFASIIGRAQLGEWSIQAFVDLLEQQGFASTLAEPNLVALSGETAVFFAGGEFPVPVPQTGIGSNTITIEYKPYGVSIAFTPTVYGDSINLVVAPEVSALDKENSVTILGFKVPGITTRRAKTTIELRNGQSFAIAGLIKREFTDSLRGLPGSTHLPVLGSLMRSTSFSNDETEVLIIVTAHLAKPTTRENLLVPTDVRRGPTEPELFLQNKTDVPVQPAGAASPPPPPPTPPAAPRPSTPQP